MATKVYINDNMDVIVKVSTLIDTKKQNDELSYHNVFLFMTKKDDSNLKSSASEAQNKDVKQEHTCFVFVDTESKYRQMKRRNWNKQEGEKGNVKVDPSFLINKRYLIQYNDLEIWHWKINSKLGLFEA